MASSVFNALRVISRILPVSTRTAGLVSKNATRTLWSVSSSKQLSSSYLYQKNVHKSCLCGSCRGMHTRGEMLLGDVYLLWFSAVMSIFL